MDNYPVKPTLALASGVAAGLAIGLAVGGKRQPPEPKRPQAPAIGTTSTTVHWGFNAAVLLVIALFLVSFSYFFIRIFI